MGDSVGHNTIHSKYAGDPRSIPGCCPQYLMGGGLKFNKDSVTFVIESDKGEAWIAVVEKRLVALREPITDQKKRVIGFKMKNDRVKIPYTGVDVSVTISIWPNPSDACTG